MNIHEFYPRESVKDFALALFIVGSFYVSAPLVQETLTGVPWAYLPQSTLEAAVAHYDATFMTAAVVYVDFGNGVADLQADAYATLGHAIVSAPAVLSGAPPVAAVAEWYVDSTIRIEGRLSP